MMAKKFEFRDTDAYTVIRYHGSKAQHWSGKRERPTFAGVLGFILLVALPFEVIVPFVLDTVGAHTVGIILMIFTLLGLEGCTETLEEHESRHTREDDWTADDWRQYQ